MEWMNVQINSPDKQQLIIFFIWLMINLTIRKHEFVVNMN
jgi:hypothetical protein